VTVKVQTATLPIVLKLSLYRVCWFCHFTGCVGTVTIPLLIWHLLTRIS